MVALAVCGGDDAVSNGVDRFTKGDLLGRSHSSPNPIVVGVPRGRCAHRGVEGLAERRRYQSVCRDRRFAMLSTDTSAVAIPSTMRPK